MYIGGKHENQLLNLNKNFNRNKQDTAPLMKLL